MSEASGSENDTTSGPTQDSKAAGTSLAPAVDGPSGVDPFLAITSEAADAPAPRPLYARALDYSAHAAMIVGLVGFAWTVSDHVVRRQASSPSAKPAKLATTTMPATAKGVATATPSNPDEISDLRRANQKMAAEIRNLHASLEALRTTVVRERSSGDDARALSADLDSLKSSLTGLKSEQTAALAQLSGRIEKLQREERVQPAAERAASRSDHQAVDTTATASIAAPIVHASSASPGKTVPTPPAKPTVLAKSTVLASAEAGDRSEPGESEMDKSKVDASKASDTKPPVIQGWVVRDVYEGVALVEGRRGEMEVVPGVSIPGAGVVKSIERHGSGWTVTTTKGQLAYAAPMRDYRRGPGPVRGYYGPPRGWDY